jgi:hypothetical protein
MLSRRSACCLCGNEPRSTRTTRSLTFAVERPTSVYNASAANFKHFGTNHRTSLGQQVAKRRWSVISLTVVQKTRKIARDAQSWRNRESRVICNSSNASNPASSNSEKSNNENGPIGYRIVDWHTNITTCAHSAPSHDDVSVTNSVTDRSSPAPVREPSSCNRTPSGFQLVLPPLPSIGVSPAAKDILSRLTLRNVKCVERQMAQRHMPASAAVLAGIETAAYVPQCLQMHGQQMQRYPAA